jgi:hypothetical protein
LNPKSYGPSRGEELNEQSIISELLYMGITFFAPKLSLGLFESYFLQTRPRFASLHPKSTGSDASQGGKAEDQVFVDAMVCREISATRFAREPKVEILA